MVKSKNFKKLVLVGGSCLLMAVISWYWTELKFNYYKNQSLQDGKKIAQIKSKINKVTQNQEGHLTWYELESGEIIYSGTSIQTSKKSHLEIVTNAGEVIEVGADSLIRFSQNEDQVRLMLEEGKIEISKPITERLTLDNGVNDTAKALVINTDLGDLKTKSSRVRLQAHSKNKENGKAKVNFQIIEGDAELAGQSISESTRNEDGTELKITAPEKVQNNLLPQTNEALIEKLEKAGADVVAQAEKAIAVPPVEPPPVTVPSNPVVEMRALSSEMPSEQSSELAPPMPEGSVETKTPEKPAAKRLLSAPKLKQIKIKEAEE